MNVSEPSRMSLGSVGASLARVGVTVSGLSMRSAEGELKVLGAGRITFLHFIRLPEFTRLLFLRDF